MSEQINNKYRVGKSLYHFLTLAAFIVDIVEIVLAFTGAGEIVNYVIDIVKIVAIPAFLVFKDIPLQSKGLMLRLILTGVIALIPFVGSLLPETLYIVWKSISSARKEDKKKIESGEGVSHNDFKTRLKRSSKFAINSQKGVKKNSKVTRQKGGNQGKANRNIQKKEPSQERAKEKLKEYSEERIKNSKQKRK